MVLAPGCRDAPNEPAPTPPGGVSTKATPTPPAGVSPLSAPAPATYWRDGGFIALTPAVRLPTNGNGRLRTQVWLKLPEEGVIQYTPLPSDRWTLKFPPKTIVDRVDYWALGSDPSEPTFDPAQGVVLDVRGAELDARGKTRWRVMRPERSGRGAPLFGYSWPRGDSVAASYVVDTMVAAMSEGMGFYAKLSGDKLTRGQHRYRTISACNSCHPRNKPETTAIHKRRDHLYRATDDHGWFTPRSVFAKAIPFETYRPRDLNGEQPWLQALCPSGDAAKRSSMKGNDTWTCEGDGVPRGTLALASACAAGDRHARAVCETRRSLFERLDPAGKKALAAMVAACESCQDR